MTFDIKDGAKPAAAALLYFAAGLWISSLLGTWTDEEYSLATTAHGVGYAIYRAIHFELQAPLYFALLAAWRELNGSVWFARLLSLLAATALFLALVPIGRRVAPELNPLPFAAIVALNPFVVNSALEIRLYAFALLISALMWLSFDAGFVSGSSLRARVAFVLLAILGIYVQYFLAFMLVGFASSLAILGRRREMPAYAIAGALVALAALPLAIVARSQLGGYTVPGRPALELLRLTIVHPSLDFVFPYDHRWNVIPALHTLYHALVVLAVAGVAAGLPKLSRETVAYVSCAVAIAATYVALALVLSEELNQRYFVALFVPIAVAVYALFREVRRGSRPHYVFAFAPIVVLASCALVTRWSAPAQPGDWKRVAPYLQAHAGPGDVIAIFPPDGLPAFERQYGGNVPFVAFPRPYSTEHYSVAGVSVGSESEAHAAFAKLAGYRRVWFVDDVDCTEAVPAYGCDFVLDEIDRDFRTDSQSEYFNATVYELSRLAGGAALSKPAR